MFSHAYFFGADRHFEVGYIAMHTAGGPPMGTIDLVLACPAAHPAGGATIDIRLLRSTDHDASWEYVTTMLTPDDAEALGATSNKINGGDLFYADGAYYLIATSLGLVEFPEGTDEGYRGCLVIPVEDLDRGFRDARAFLSSKFPTSGSRANSSVPAQRTKALRLTVCSFP